MTPNRLQFQTGLSLSSFLKDYGSEAQCEAALEKYRWPKGYICTVCESHSHCIVWHDKVISLSAIIWTVSRDFQRQ
jgi:hypothetical protein